MNNIFPCLDSMVSNLPENVKFTLVGGCFDLIHVGHIHLLEYAASLEERLVVAVLSDLYVEKYKNNRKPIIDQAQRAKMVASIRFVDFVFISNVSPSSIDTLSRLKPTSVVFEENLIDGTKNASRIKNITLASPNTRVKFLPRYNDTSVSTTKIIDRIKN